MTSRDCSHKPSGLTLALAGCEDRLQLALGDPGPDRALLLASREWTVPGQSVRFLLPGLDETLRAFGVGMEAVARIACVRGPGSFTGLRLVLAAAEGLAAGRGLPLAGLDYLPLLAEGPAPADRPLHVVTYARRGLVYLQSFAASDRAPLGPVLALRLEDVPGHLDAAGENALLLGSGLRKNAEFFADLAAGRPGCALLPPRFDAPSPQLLLDAACRAEFGADSVEPVYVRPSDAEENLPNIARQRGLDPDEAVRRLDELQRS
ncbi:tRNA (adenosine(37)-N6)-threonylcarbamoyltransferase complex dimerization subunit type 1 TsaB [Pseudodesulfovibrio sp.]|uniref:tRNA (adenosine(37)-N6)-threonylcarbamoyltransferase complex dimerization subunit type 1 TsaB n=1 Tax=Pseudodesulfovibrio sp. TaxID=2035812 RepID=UPI0026222C13|nr:tRNA (adenosine(37)-N6)-threonylcarbamoyltransferase complex dimerization subunit type 1 TsaB [Pseudodesulfovibrio sp.]MDD3313530.1 tRNA (adenosine(37)-N6)-threonylcarbamoyltransferase complex dimerization subunit type 1 TsaB [Pseudodesulfovibrio sp.]